MPALFDLSLFGDLRDRDLRREGVCIGEGLTIAERMLRSDWNILGVLCTPGFAERCKAMSGGVPVEIRDEKELREITGFPFHRGVLVAAKRPEIPRVTQFSHICNDGENGEPGLVVLSAGVSDPENLGSIFRSASALGARAVVVGPGSADVFSRRVLRVSMGAVLTLPVAGTDGPDEVRATLKSAGYAMVGAVANANSVSSLSFDWPRKTALILGEEYHGLGREWLDVCDSSVSIPMTKSVDSLNVGVAAGICMYSYTAAHGFLV